MRQGVLEAAGSLILHRAGDGRVGLPAAHCKSDSGTRRVLDDTGLSGAAATMEYPVLS